MPEQSTTCRYFTSYSGAKLPLKLVGELDESDMRNRNTYFRGRFDAAGQLIACEKLVYGEIEFRHEYRYHPDGRIAHAMIDDGSNEPATVDYPA
jgi:hypothetical protein